MGCDGEEDRHCTNCGVVYCRRIMQICPLCGEPDFPTAGGNFDEWLEKQLNSVRARRCKKFIPKKDYKFLCETCKRPELDHSIEALKEGRK
jgi:RNA polymerase subunit RPABC4/transcription elongation factor Spt4